MSAAGTGFTTGTNAMTVNLRFDEASRGLFMDGEGRSIRLNPMKFATDESGKQADNAPFEMSVEKLTAGGLSSNDLEALNECGSPTRYWWQMGSGARKSWGGLMFYGNNNATGFMANSADGSRFVLLSR
ncbi:MAG: hypothetical protein AAF737_01035 [Pseudomonadota bacterium]